MFTGEPPGSPGAGSAAGKAGDARPAKRGACGAPGPPPQQSRSDRSVTAFLRIFFVGGIIAFRGLFNWIRPAMYIPTMFGSPLFQLIFFTKLGQYAHAED